MGTPLTPATVKKRTASMMEEEGEGDANRTLAEAFKLLAKVGMQWDHDRCRGVMSDEVYHAKLTKALGTAFTGLTFTGPVMNLLKKDDAVGLKALVDKTGSKYTATFEGKPVAVLHATLQVACLKGSNKCFDAVLEAWSGVLNDAKQAKGLFLFLLQGVQTAPYVDRLMDSDHVAPFKTTAVEAVKHVIENSESGAPRSYFGFVVRKALIYCSRKRESIEEIKSFFQYHDAKSVVETALVGFLEVHGIQKE
jgi:hypothetical protein